MGGFLAVPVGGAGDGGRGPLSSGRPFGEEERVLDLISAAVGSALEAAEDAPGGRDPVSGLPNRASLRRVLGRELSRGRALTVFAVEVGYLGRYNRVHGFSADDELLRRVGEGLGGGRRAFRYGGTISSSSWVGPSRLGPAGRRWPSGRPSPRRAGTSSVPPSASFTPGPATKTPTPS